MPARRKNSFRRRPVMPGCFYAPEPTATWTPLPCPMNCRSCCKSSGGGRPGQMAVGLASMACPPIIDAALYSGDEGSREGLPCHLGRLMAGVGGGLHPNRPGTDGQNLRTSPSWADAPVRPRRNCAAAHLLRLLGRFLRARRRPRAGEAAGPGLHRSVHPARIRRPKRSPDQEGTWPKPRTGKAAPDTVDSSHQPSTPCPRAGGAAWRRTTTIP